MNRCIYFVVISLLLLSCGKRNNNENEDLFYINKGVECYHVIYRNDSILIEGKYNYKKYEYFADSTVLIEKKENAVSRPIALYKKNGEFYYSGIEGDVRFLSNRVTNYECEIGINSVTIQEVKDSLFESTLFINITKTHRNPVLILLYDKSYKIRRIRIGSLFSEYVCKE